MISVITPTHDARFLGQAYDSLKDQRVPGGMEWVVIPNGDSVGSLPEMPDTPLFKVRVIEYPGKRSRNIGALKRFACEQAKGEVIVELDHDDMLTDGAGAAIQEQFGQKDVDFLYSDFAEFFDGSCEPHVYREDYGWELYEQEHYGHQFTAMRAFDPSPQVMALVDFAPNHVRAWRASAYWEVGGHDAGMEICDDHDLCCRFYMAKRRMIHIPSCLYLYREHQRNNYKVKQQAIRNATEAVRRKYLWRMAEAWADMEGLPKADLGAAHGKPEGYIGIDIREGPGVDIVRDVTEGLPFDDDSVGIIRAADFLEHIRNPVPLINEIWRVLVDGGWFLSATPSTDGRGAFQDPTHVSFWNENSFWYYTDKQYAAYVDGIECRFQRARLETYHPSDFCRNHDIQYVYADLVATKSWRRRPGRVLI